MSASTPQDRALREYGYELLAGDGRDAVLLGLRRSDGSVFEVEVARSGWDEVRSPFGNRDEILQGNVGYLCLDDFGSGDAAGYVLEAMRRLSDVDGLIVDVRYNGDGSSWPGYLLLTTLANSTFETNPSWTRVPEPSRERRDMTSPDSEPPGDTLPSSSSQAR